MSNNQLTRVWCMQRLDVTRMVKQWLKIVCSDQRKLISIAYDNIW